MKIKNELKRCKTDRKEGENVCASERKKAVNETYISNRLDFFFFFSISFAANIELEYEQSVLALHYFYKSIEIVTKSIYVKYKGITKKKKKKETMKNVGRFGTAK